MTTASEIRTRLLDLLAGADVAAAAGIAAASWASLTVPHVFDGDSMATGGRNRGRMPFVEFFIEAQPFTPEGSEIGEVATTVRLRVHVGGANRTTAHALASAILTACFAAARSDEYFDLGSSESGTFASQPCWHYLEGTLGVQHTYDPETYEG